MLRAFKIVLLLLAVLITYINSGICKVYTSGGRKILNEESLPNTQHLSVIEYILYSTIDFGLKNRLSSDKFNKLSKEIRSWQYIAKYELIEKDQVKNNISLLRNPLFIVKVFSSGDICFPFNYFW